MKILKKGCSIMEKKISPLFLLNIEMMIIPTIIFIIIIILLLCNAKKLKNVPNKLQW